MESEENKPKFREKNSTAIFQVKFCVTIVVSNLQFELNGACGVAEVY